jgi:hypothetical protein
MESSRWNDIDKENRRTRRKTYTRVTLSITWTDPGANPGLHGERPTTNRLNHGKALHLGVVNIVDFFIFPLTSVSRPALGPTQPPVQWVPGVLSPGLKRGRGVTLTTHPCLVSRSIMSRSYISSSFKRLRCV